MRTKLRAGRLAARSATTTIIASGHAPDVLRNIAAGRQVGTLLYSNNEKVSARKQWLGGTIRARGSLRLDEGACRALLEQGKSLLAVGVTAVTGEFSRGELVVLEDQGGVEVGRGLVNYSAGECHQIAGLPSDQIETVLGFCREAELIHRDNLLVDSRA
jgi:glutamate 5-kinase